MNENYAMLEPHQISIKEKSPRLTHNQANLPSLKEASRVDFKKHFHFIELESFFLISSHAESCRVPTQA